MKKTINTLGSTTLNNAVREDLDFYQTPTYATKTLIQHFDFKSNFIWEPMAGNGAISKVLKEVGKLKVFSTDIIQREYPLDRVMDYFQVGEQKVKIDLSIVTNPPYEFANQFLKHTLENIRPRTCSLFLPIRYLEGQKRYDEIYSKYKPAKVLTYVKRLGCYKQSDVEKGPIGELGVGSAVAYMWLCFDRETWSDPNSKTEIEWIN